ncbi:hypothetical protein D3C80_1939080 [compost metagenome]
MLKEVVPEFDRIAKILFFELFGGSAFKEKIIFIDLVDLNVTFELIGGNWFWTWHTKC